MRVGVGGRVGKVNEEMRRAKHVVKIDEKRTRK
jgi:hypothetical protein